MGQEEYRSCIAKGLKGKQLNKEERKLEFCIVSKTCSGKAKDREEAKAICSLPKEPKLLRAKKGKPPVSCKEEMLTLAQCMVSRIDMNLVSNTKSIETALVDALLKCQCHS